MEGKEELHTEKNENWTEIWGCQFIRLCTHDPKHLSYTILHFLRLPSYENEKVINNIISQRIYDKTFYIINIQQLYT